MTYRENYVVNTVVGMGLGALAGGGLGFDKGSFIIEDAVWFPGETVLLCALIGGTLCGIVGFFYGAGFVQWLEEHWWESW